MPRYRRRIAPGSVQHVISRFVHRDFLFDVPQARDEYLRRATTVFARVDWHAVAFALMSSHVHWVLCAGNLPSSALIKPLHSGFAGWLNRASGRLGPVFADRHRSITCVGETAAAVIAYVHNNPVRAGLVKHSGQSSWTSHRMYLGRDEVPPWLDVERGLELCGFPSSRAGRKAFHAFVTGRAQEPRCGVLSGAGMARRRSDARTACSGPVDVAWPIADLIERRRLLRAPVIVPDGCPRRSELELSATSTLSFVARHVDISLTILRSRSRVRSVVAVRRLVLVLWVRQLARPTVQMARVLGLADSSAAKLLATATPSVHAHAEQLARALMGGADESMTTEIPHG